MADATPTPPPTPSPLPIDDLKTVIADFAAILKDGVAVRDEMKTMDLAGLVASLRDGAGKFREVVSLMQGFTAVAKELHTKIHLGLPH